MSTRFGEELRRLREEKGLSQQALGAAVGLTQGMIGHIERGLVPGVSAATLYKLVEALGVPCMHFREFLDESAEAKPGKPTAKRKKSK